MRIFNWEILPIICERKSDKTLWTPAGDSPFPLNGWNFVRARKARFGWWLEFNERWVFTESGLFEITQEKHD